MNALQGVAACLETAAAGEIHVAESRCAARRLGCIERMLDFVKLQPGQHCARPRQRIRARHRRGLRPPRATLQSSSRGRARPIMAARAPRGGGWSPSVHECDQTLTDFTSVRNHNERAVYDAVLRQAERYSRAWPTTPSCWLMWPAWR